MTDPRINDSELCIDLLVCFSEIEYIEGYARALERLKVFAFNDEHAEVVFTAEGEKSMRQLDFTNAIIVYDKALRLNPANCTLELVRDDLKHSQSVGDLPGR